MNVRRGAERSRDRQQDPCTDSEAEHTWLGCVLLDEKTLESCPVPPEDFHHRGYELVARTMLSLRRANIPVDTVTVRIELAKAGDLARAGGDEMLLDLTGVVPSLHSAFVVAARISECAEMRRRRDHAKRIVAACESQNLDEARGLSASISGAYDPSTVKIQTFKEVTTATLRSYQDMGTEKDRSVKLGTPTVDRMWSPYPGSVTTLGASTGSGKTSLMCVWALSMARRGLHVGIISVEDPSEDFGGKWLGELGKDYEYPDADRPIANPSKFWKGEATAADHELALRAAAEHENLPIFFAHVRSRKLDDVLIAMRGMARRHRTRVIMLDYLQVIRPREHYRDRRDAIDAVLDDVIVEASTLEQALVIGSQLSRDGAKQAEPRVQDLKESGTIEERSQAIVLAWPSDKKIGTVYGKVAKAKRVMTGSRFTLVRNPISGALEEESDDDYGGDDTLTGGYQVGSYGKKKK